VHLPPPLNAWTDHRALNAIPPESFREWWAKRVPGGRS
jgi:L-lactate dehydrogenase complex protein LldF